MCIFYSWCTKCNSKWLLERDRDHVKKAERMERPQKTDEHLKFSAQYGCRDELMYSRCEMLSCSQTWYKAVAVASLSLSYLATNHNDSRHLLAKH